MGEPAAPYTKGEEAGERPLLLPPHIAPSDDLTWRVLREAGSTPSPFDGLAQYETVFDSLARGLYRRQSPHVLLVGERGVGKVLLTAEFARRAVRGTIPLAATIRCLSVDTRFFPEDESRTRLAAVLAHTVRHENTVIFWEGLAELVTGGGKSNVRLLLGALVGAQCHFVVLLDEHEYENFAGENPDLLEAFSRVNVPEPDGTAALQILSHLARGLEVRYDLEIDPSALERAVALTSRFVLNDQLPGKALKAIVAACEEANYDRAAGIREVGRVSVDHVIRAVSQRTGLPQALLRGVAERIDYELALSDEVYGQPDVIREVAAELGLIRAGMTDTGRPASVMLFLGPTGTGKTELAKVLARFYSYSRRLKIYSLANCIEPHSVSTVIGVPPGYVGSDRGGRIVNELNADPFGVFLLDEADKAHPDVLQPFLHLFDEGWVVDQRGTRAYGNKAIFVLTSNVGQRMITDLRREGKPPDEIVARMKEALSQIRHPKADRPVFPPEFLARLRRILVFQPLDGVAMASIAAKLLAQIGAEWRDRRGRTLIVEPSLIEYLGRAADRLDERLGRREGGRVVRKLIADWIESPVQRAMATRSGEYGAAATVTVQAKELSEPESGQPYPSPMVEVVFLRGEGPGADW